MKRRLVVILLLICITVLCSCGSTEGSMYEPSVDLTLSIDDIELDDIELDEIENADSLDKSTEDSIIDESSDEAELSYIEGEVDRISESKINELESNHKMWMDGIFTLDGNEIHLPIAYNDLVNLGWKLAENGDMEYKKGVYSDLGFVLKNEDYPDVNMKVMFVNLTDRDSAVLTECSVWAISLSRSTYDRVYDKYPTVDIDGIKFGSFYEDIINVFGDGAVVEEKEFDTNYLYNYLTSAVGFSLDSEYYVDRIQIAYVLVDN